MKNETKQKPLDRLKHHVSGAIERGEKTAVTAVVGTKHTLGPWTVYTPPEMIHMRTVLVGPKYMIKNVLPQDARLIAAAPEMLEALEALVNSIGQHDFDDQHDLFTLCQQVIAKAKGVTR